jgi:hypothetical protein
VDNDCDGLTDEDLGTVTCGLGVCQHTVQACKDGKQVQCDPLSGASEETCGDGLDNDCDGVKDTQCGPDLAGTCVGKLCCDKPCTGTCAACQPAGIDVAICTAHAGGSDPDKDCGVYHCSGSGVTGTGSSECFAACEELDYALYCKPGYHCDAAVCVADVAPGGACDEDTDCTSLACRMDWDGQGTFCAADATSCVDDDGGQVGQRGDGWVECDLPDAWRRCDKGNWLPAAPAGATQCGAATCNGGCGYVTDEDNACVSGDTLGVGGGCEVGDLGKGFVCADCGDLTAHAGGCDAGVDACSIACGAECTKGQTKDAGVDACYPDADGNAYNRIDVCALTGSDCAWSDDGHASDTLAKDCGAFDCTAAGVCLTDCAGDNSKCNTGAFCKDGSCLDLASALPWKPSGNYWVLTKSDGTWFGGNDCPGNFWGVNEPTVSGVPFVVGPYMAGGGSQLAGILPNVYVPVPFGSWTVKSVYTIFPGGRCSGQPLNVTFKYTDGSTATTGTANIPHDCGYGGSWSGSNFNITGEGNYGGPCCAYWYMGQFLNPNPGKKVASFSFYYYDGCGGSYSGQMWAATVD